MPVATQPSATVTRLLHALEDLARREDIALATGDAHTFLDLEQRSEPLARRLAELVSAGVRLAPDVLRRGEALIADRRERQLRLIAFMESIRDELGQLDAARARARDFRVQRVRLAPEPSAFVAVG